MNKRMGEKQKVDISKVNNPYEKDILYFLNTNGKCIYGEIIKELRMSAARGQDAIYSLLNKGLIKYKDKSSYIELNVNLK